MNREEWGTKIGLIFAMSGTAIGLGNFWRFPYQAGVHGGGAFMVPYFILILIIGIPIMLVEWGIGRNGGRYGHGTLGPMMYLQARNKLKPKNAALIGATVGMLGFAICLLVTSYYNHIIGWSLGYSVMELTGAYGIHDSAVATNEIFDKYLMTPGFGFIFWALAVGGSAYSVMGGIKNGIEKWAKILMPALFVLGIFLVFRSLTFGSPVNPDWSALQGLNFVWEPNWSNLSWTAVLAAAGQIFFTLALGQGIIHNYASYLKTDDDVVTSGIATASLNEFAEVILGGSIVIPITFAFLGPDSISSGIGLTFISLPNAFRDMAGGAVIGSAWFFLLAIAGYTSAVALFNYLVSMLEEDMNVKRKKATWIVFALMMLAGLPSGIEPFITGATTLAFFTELDNWVGSYLMVLVGLLEVIIFGWLGGKMMFDDLNYGSYWKVPNWVYTIFIKFVTPITILVILIFSTRDYFNNGYFNFIPSFIADSPELVPWVLGARILMLIVLVIGFIQSYKAIKKYYGQEMLENRIIINKMPLTTSNETTLGTKEEGFVFVEETNKGELQ